MSSSARTSNISGNFVRAKSSGETVAKTCYPQSLSCPRYEHHGATQVMSESRGGRALGTGTHDLLKTSLSSFGSR